MSTILSNEVVFPARIEQLANICQTVTDAARGCGMDDRNLWKLETAVDEACTNIACYGYQGRADGFIVIRWECKNGFLYVTIEDSGIPFDQSQPTAPDLDCDLCKRKAGGLGRFIMRKFLDDMRYQRVGQKNRLTLVKHLHAGNADN
jgi:serine/threonine-protein kinase RsbW